MVTEQHPRGLSMFSSLSVSHTHMHTEQVSRILSGPLPRRAIYVVTVTSESRAGPRTQEGLPGIRGTDACQALITYWLTFVT